MDKLLISCFGTTSTRKARIKSRKSLSIWCFVAEGLQSGEMDKLFLKASRGILVCCLWKLIYLPSHGSGPHICSQGGTRPRAWSYPGPWPARGGGLEGRLRAFTARTWASQLGHEFHNWAKNQSAKHRQFHWKPNWERCGKFLNPKMIIRWKPGVCFTWKNTKPTQEL